MSAIHRENLEPPEFDLLYGIHTVSEALNNPKRKFVQLLATKNAAARLAVSRATLRPLAHWLMAHLLMATGFSLLRRVPAAWRCFPWAVAARKPGAQVRRSGQPVRPARRGFRRFWVDSKRSRHHKPSTEFGDGLRGSVPSGKGGGL